MLRSDFFQPLCDLIDDTVTIDVKDMGLTNMSTVLSLSEICLRTIKKMPLGKVNDLIIHVLLCECDYKHEGRSALSW